MANTNNAANQLKGDAAFDRLASTIQEAILACRKKLAASRDQEDSYRAVLRSTLAEIYKLRCRIRENSNEFNSARFVVASLDDKKHKELIRLENLEIELVKGYMAPSDAKDASYFSHVLKGLTAMNVGADEASWSELPELTEGTFCGPELPGVGSRVDQDEFALVTHSLGSRATMDAMQRLTNLPLGEDPRLRHIADDFRDREVQVFMLSNQLPLLEAGREAQTVIEEIGAYCGPAATEPGRFFGQTRLVAFSDPNDVMSYPVPDRFAERYIDSRLCPTMTNVTINVAAVNAFLGLGEVANPLGAHTGYGADERIGTLIARGAGNPNVAPIVAERCTWRETDESLMR